MTEKNDDVTAETPIVDAEDAKDFREPEQKSDVDQLAEGLKKAATETAYATVGLVDLVSSKAREFYDDQKKQYATAHPDEDAQTTSGFLTQLGSQLDKLVADIAGGFRDLADRGRSAGRDSAPAPEVTKGAEAPAAESEAPEASEAADDGPAY
ncbi:hypothetical protein [Tessaracoccus lacteus]|uniref:Uncharacterized protein n=1 Tax=Tessaracoccus lacteus TaxID=3041766 RepID=A0ABY8PWN4_9ACTN|nr:hypothetical protein [Tessaracoccus sp. T21]WGT46900.1 hypothetical protein QH948_12285 [Tessaracoccus sp. T21]